MWNKALNAKYSVSFCLPFLSGTLLAPVPLTADLEEKLKGLLTELERQRDKGEWNMCIGSIEQDERNMENDARKWLD